ncbi:MAG: urease accessory protein UreF, partial [Guyparkeria sp.]
MPMRTDASVSATDDLAMLGLLQLVSPALPIGAFAWSQGLESAMDLGWVTDRDELGDWLDGVLEDGLGRADLPVLMRLHRAWASGDAAAIETWNDWLLAGRETAELHEEDVRLGAALRRLMGDLDRLPAGDLLPDEPGYVTMFAMVAQQRGVDAHTAMLGLAWAWLENQLAVACKAMPLGHTAAQSLVESLRPSLVAVVRRCAHHDDAELGPV